MSADPKVRLPDDYDYAGLVTALRSGRQCDEDGTDIQVSRQAAEEGATAVEQLRADLSSSRAERERLTAENANLLRGEFICRSCGLRKNAESSGAVEF